MPEGAVYVGRGSRWGNPWPFGTAACPLPEDAVANYRAEIDRCGVPALHLLRGRDLCCWCPLDQPCHADVLLDLANRKPNA
jgi:hypothetical protein